MNEIALPILGPVFVFGLVMPAAAILSRLALWFLGKASTTHLHGHGALRYALIIGPTAIPVAWFISACLHQAEVGTGADVCTVPDPPGVLCPEVALFAIVLLTLVALAAVPRFLRERRVFRSSGCQQTKAAKAARARLENLLRGHRDLLTLLDRILISDDCEEPIATRGVLSPRVIVHSSFLQSLDDDALVGAIRHEAEHIRGRDPLRYFLGWWSLSANPIGRWLLRSELHRWILARETHCDREAVLAGASAPALAHAVVQAARFSRVSALPIATSALGAASANVLSLRIGLLMAYTEKPPRRCCRTHALRFAICAVLFAIALPHGFGAAGLDSLHRATETVAGSLRTRN